MPKLVKSRAFILKRLRHGDTSLILHAFTREFGRIPFIAKGARTGGRRPPVPLVSVVELEFVWSKSTRSELQLLREWSLEDGFGGVHSDFTKLAWAQAAMEVLARTLPDEEEHGLLYDLTREYLQTLAQVNDRYGNLFILFRLLALREIGYEVTFDSADPAQRAFIYVPGQGFVDQKTAESQGTRGVRIAPGSMKSLELLARKGFADAVRFKISRDAEEEIERLLNAAYRHSFDRWGKLESMKLLQPYPESGSI